MTTLLAVHSPGANKHIYRNVDLAGWTLQASYESSPRPGLKRLRIAPDLITVYACSNSANARFAASLDAGVTWATTLTPTGERFRHIEPDPLIAGTAWAAGQNSASDTARVYKSTDYGANWTTKLSVAASVGAQITGFITCAAPDGTLFFMADDGTDLAGIGNAALLVYRSTDGGDNWSLVASLTPATGGVPSTLSISLDGSRLIATSYSALNTRDVWESTDNGDNWTHLTDLALVRFSGLPVPNSSGVFLANLQTQVAALPDTKRSAIWRSAAVGASFSNIGDYAVDDYVIAPFDGDNVGSEFAFAVPHGNPSVIYGMNSAAVLGDSHIYRSLDGGDSWELYDSQPSFDWTALAVIDDSAPDDRRTFLSLVRDGGKGLL